jgi:glutamyl aminopeptidase
MAISGDEQEVSQILKAEYTRLDLPVVYDGLGSIYAYKASKNPQAKTLMIAAHMDEVGFVLSSITAEGALKIAPVGGWWSQVLLSQRVIVKNKKGEKFKGSIASIPPHLLTEQERSKPMEIKHMLVDLGCSSKEEVLALGIQVGDALVLDGPFEILYQGKRLLSKAWDNRYGCILGVELLEALKDQELDVNLYVGASVQEEVGLRGAGTSAFKIKPDLAIVFDCSPANDLSGDKQSFGFLGKGPLVRFIDANYLPHRGFIHHYVDLLDQTKIPYQYYQSLGGTDAGAIHKSNEGIPTLTQCICARNIHSSSSIIDVFDYLSALKASIAVVESLNDATIEMILKANQ